MAVSTFENNLLDTATAVIMAPVALLWLLWQAVMALVPYRKYIGLALVIAGAVAVCWACPALPLGLAIVAAFGWVTMPKAVRPC